MDKLKDILINEATKLDMEFRDASSLGKGTPQETATFREGAFRDFLRRFYPAPYRIVQGKIHDLFDHEPSHSIDSIIVNPIHPHLIDTEGKFKLLLADGIDAAIEVKPDISNTTELERALKQGVSVKKLSQVTGPLILSDRHPKYIQDFSKKNPIFCFHFKGKSKD
jgi:hypothetical protein